MSEDIPCSLPDTQTQTQNSQVEWSQSSTPVILPSIWGRLYPIQPSKTLGLRRSTVGLQHSFTDYIDLSLPKFKLGRAAHCNLVIKDGVLENETLKSTSKEHLMIEREASEQYSPVILHDLSYNGTFVNGKLVGKGNKRILETSDEIAITQPTKRLFVFMDLFKNDQQLVPTKISQKYYVSKILGTGACGIVKLVYNKMTCEKYAMKIITKKRLTNAQKHPLNDPVKISNEVEILKALKHPCVISTKEVIDTDEAVHIILELMAGGELFDRVSSLGRLEERSAKIVFRQMVLAVKYLHDCGITHRDLKPENVLLLTNEKDTLIKLTDFGLSKFVGEENFMKTMCGTPLYVAPEVLLAEGRKSYGQQIDVWSLGVILFICLSGYLPFSNEYKDLSLKEQILKGRYMFSRKHWEGVSIPARQLTVKMLNVNPVKRITLDGILRDPWMQDDDVIMKVEELMASWVPDPSADKILVPSSSTPVMKRLLSEDCEKLEPAPKRRKISMEGTSSSNNYENISIQDDTADELSAISLCSTKVISV